MTRTNFEIEYFDHPLMIINVILGHEKDKNSTIFRLEEEAK